MHGMCLGLVVVFVFLVGFVNGFLWLFTVAGINKYRKDQKNKKEKENKEKTSDS